MRPFVYLGVCIYLFFLYCICILYVYLVQWGWYKCSCVTGWLCGHYAQLHVISGFTRLHAFTSQSFEHSLYYGLGYSEIKVNITISIITHTPNMVSHTLCITVVTLKSTMGHYTLYLCNGKIYAIISHHTLHICIMASFKHVVIVVMILNPHAGTLTVRGLVSKWNFHGNGH